MQCLRNKRMVPGNVEQNPPDRHALFMSAVPQLLGTQDFEMATVWIQVGGYPGDMVPSVG